MREELEPLVDGLIRRCLRAGDWATGGKLLWHRMLGFLVGEPGACCRCSRAACAPRVKKCPWETQASVTFLLHAYLRATPVLNCAPKHPSVLPVVPGACTLKRVLPVSPAKHMR